MVSSDVGFVSRRETLKERKTKILRLKKSLKPFSHPGLFLNPEFETEGPRIL
jgi:hypothetical protein